MIITVCERGMCPIITVKASITLGVGPATLTVGPRCYGPYCRPYCGPYCSSYYSPYHRVYVSPYHRGR